MWSKTMAVVCASALAVFFASAVQAQLMFDFEDGNLDGWQAIDEAPENLGDAGPSSWEVRASELGLDGNALYQGSNIWGSAGDTSLMGTFLIYMGEKFTDFTIDVDVAAADNDGMGLVWGYESTAKHYRAIMINDRWPDVSVADGIEGPFLKIAKRISDAEPWYELLAVVKDDYVPYPEGPRMHWTLEVRDKTFTFTRDDGLSLSASDADYAGGYVGLQLYAQQAEFDNFKITPLNATAVDPAGKLAATWAQMKTAP